MEEIIYNNCNLGLNYTQLKYVSKKICGLIRHVKEGITPLEVDKDGYTTPEKLYDKAWYGYMYKINNYDTFINIIEYLCDKKINYKTRLILVKKNNIIIKIRSGEGYSRDDVEASAKCTTCYTSSSSSTNSCNDTVIVHCSYREYYYSIIKDGLMTKERIGKQNEILQRRKHVYFYELSNDFYNQIEDLIKTTGRNTFYYTTLNILKKNNYTVYKSENGVILVELNSTESINHFYNINDTPLNIIKNNQNAELINYLEKKISTYK